MENQILQQTKVNSMIKVLEIKTRGRYDFREAYDSLPRKYQPYFRKEVMNNLGWSSRMTFYGAMRGENYLTDLQVNSIKSIFKKYGIEV